MARTATTEQVAAALHVGPATVRKYAREHRLPYDTTPGGHRRFDVEEAVEAILGDRAADPDAGDWASPRAEQVPYAWVEPHEEHAATAIVTAFGDAPVSVYDGACELEDWATETPVV